MTAEDEAREAFEQVCELFGEMAKSLRLLGEAMASAAETVAVFAAAVGHPVKCSMPCPACDEQLAEFERSLRNNEEGRP